MGIPPWDAGVGSPGGRFARGFLLGHRPGRPVSSGGGGGAGGGRRGGPVCEVLAGAHVFDELDRLGGLAPPLGPAFRMCGPAVEDALPTGPLGRLPRVVVEPQPVGAHGLAGGAELHGTSPGSVTARRSPASAAAHKGRTLMPCGSVAWSAGSLVSRAHGGTLTRLALASAAICGPNRARRARASSRHVSRSAVRSSMVACCCTTISSASACLPCAS